MGGKTIKPLAPYFSAHFTLSNASFVDCSAILTTTGILSLTNSTEFLVRIFFSSRLKVLASPKDPARTIACTSDFS